MKWAIILMLIAGLASGNEGTFNAVWNANAAEISSYRVVLPGYCRKGIAWEVLVFVPQDLHLATRVRVEDSQPVPEKDKVPVVGFKRTPILPAGIYDNQGTTAVFSSLVLVLGQPALFPLKISVTGPLGFKNTYCHLLPDAQGARFVMPSTKNGEGKQESYLKSPERMMAVYEDQFPVLVRELKGEFLQVGEKRELAILPALGQSRTGRESLQYEKGWLKKGYGEEIYVNGRYYSSYQWSWQVGDRLVSYWVEREYPHTILRWESSDGSSGFLVKSFFKPHWQPDAGQHRQLKEELGIL